MRIERSIAVQLIPLLREKQMNTLLCSRKRVPPTTVKLYKDTVRLKSGGKSIQEEEAKGDFL